MYRCHPVTGVFYTSSEEVYLNRPHRKESYSKEKPQSAILKTASPVIVDAKGKNLRRRKSPCRCIARGICRCKETPYTCSAGTYYFMLFLEKAAMSLVEKPLDTILVTPLPCAPCRIRGWKRTYKFVAEVKVEYSLDQTEDTRQPGQKVWDAVETLRVILGKPRQCGSDDQD